MSIIYGSQRTQLPILFAFIRDLDNTRFRGKQYISMWKRPFLSIIPIYILGKLLNIAWADHTFIRCVIFRSWIRHFYLINIIVGSISICHIECRWKWIPAEKNNQLFKAFLPDKWQSNSSRSNIAPNSPQRDTTCFSHRQSLFYL